MKQLNVRDVKGQVYYLLDNLRTLAKQNALYVKDLVKSLAPNVKEVVRNDEQLSIR